MESENMQTPKRAAFPSQDRKTRLETLWTELAGERLRGKLAGGADATLSTR